MNKRFRHKTPVIIGVLVFCAAFILLVPIVSRGASQAALFLNPAAGSFLVGSTFDVSVVLDTKGVSVNTVEVEIDFPADKIQVANPSIGRSIIQLWPAPPVFSNREGKIYFVGGIPSPGLVTSQGVVLTLTFRVIAPGQGELKFLERTSVLANDGRGTNILGQKPSVFFTFLVPAPQGPIISSPTHPDQERWYRDNNPVFVWSKSPFASAYSYSIDRDPSGFPDTEAEGTIPTASFQNIENGIWYFHLRERAGDVWGGVSHYILKIDNQPPAQFKVNVSPASRTTNRNPIFRFFTTDALAGFDHFEMKIVPLSAGEASEAFFFEVASPYQAPNFQPGRYQVIVRAVDKAGNTRDAAVAMNILGAVSQFISPDGIDLVIFFLPWSYVLLAAGFTLLLFIILFIRLWRKHQHHLKHAFKEDIKNIFHLFGKRSAPTAVMLLALSLALLGISGAALAQTNAKPPPAAPEISVAPSVYYPLDEVLYLEGRAPAKSKLDLYFEKPGSQPVRVSAEANSNGEWFFAQKLELSSGEWTVRARTLGEPPSDWSNPRIITSRVSGFVIGSLKIRYLPIVLIFLVMLSGAFGLLLYSFLRVRTVRRLELEREMAEKTGALEKALREKEKEAAASLVEENFAEIKRSIMEELLHYDKKFAEKGEFTKEEAAHRTELLRELNRIENAIAKKLKEIA